MVLVVSCFLARLRGQPEDGDLYQQEIRGSNNEKKRELSAEG